MNRPRPDDSTWLAAELREQADGHEPDLCRIEARVERLIADQHQPVAPSRQGRLGPLRLIGAPLGIAAAVASVSVAAAVIFGISEGHNSHLSSQTTKPSSSWDSAHGTHPPTPQSTPVPTRPARPANTASTSGHPSAPPVSGPLTAIGNVDPHSTPYWAQEDLAIVTTRPTRGLHVSVTVSGDSTVQSTGSWSTIAAADLTTTVSRGHGGLIYDLALKPGQILPPGTYSFGMQFNRPATGHELGTDTYRVSVFTTDNGTLRTSVVGTFSP